MHGTKVSFMRDILSEVKLYLRQNEVNRMEVPLYQNIREELVRKRDEGRVVGEVPADQGAAVRAVAGARVLLRAAVHAAEPIYEGNHC